MSFLLFNCKIFQFIPRLNPGFKDVPTNHSAYNQIATAAHLGIISGFEENGVKLFKPADKLTRAQMAKIMAGAYNLHSDKSAGFYDVTKGHWAEKSIDGLFYSNVTKGYPGHLFKPNEPIQRVQFSLFMARHLNDDFKDKTPPVKPEPKPTPPKGNPSDGTYVIPNAPKSFQNCSAMRKYYPKGVKRGHPAYEKKHDRDNDGWACEL